MPTQKYEREMRCNLEDLLQAGVGTLETRPLPVALQIGRFSDALASCGTARLPAAVLAPPNREEAGCHQQGQANLDALVCLCGRVLIGNRIPGPILCAYEGMRASRHKDLDGIDPDELRIIELRTSL